MKGLAYFRNGLGNFLMSMPALQAVASLTESKTIDLITDADWKDSRRPAIDLIAKEWHVVDQFLNWPKQKFDPKDYGIWFFSHHGERGEASTFFLDRIHTPVPRPDWRRSLVHEVDHYMDIARSLGYQGPTPEVDFPLSTGPVLNSGIQRPFIGICNGAFNTRDWEKKKWPHFQRLSQVLKLYCGATIVGVGIEDELKDIPLDLDYTGKLSILQTAKVLSQLDLFITTDTGNMHLADMLNIPMIALFGSTLTSKNRPRGKKSIVLRSGVQCAPCQDMSRFMNCTVNQCMHSITVGDVMAVCRTVLKNL